MTLPGGLASGLAFLPTWFTETKDPQALGATLSAWVRASGWRCAGFAWPAEPNPTTVLVARDESIDATSPAPFETADVVQSLRGGSPTVVWQIPQSAGRLYTLAYPAGKSAVLLWAERGPNEPWTEADRQYLRLSARLIERSPAVAARIGPVIDPERLLHRLQDAAVIAGRMAHDFDNILTGIIGFADLSVPQLPKDSQPAKYVAEIGKVGQRGIVFTQQLHQLSRSGQIKPLPGSVPAVTAKEEARLKPVAAAGVTFVTNFPSALAAVAMDTGPLQTVLGHLMENAAEATPAGGTVTVSAKPVELNPTDAKAYLGQVGPGAHIEVTVHDTGPGIKPDVFAKLFVDPFHTTKVRHRGLGLAICYRVLYAHRGGIKIDTAPGGGTWVRTVFPLAAARPAFAPATTTTLNSKYNFGG